MFTTFTLPSGQIVHVNAAHVRRVEPYGDQSASVLRFGPDDYAIVQGLHMDVRDQLQKALN